MKPYAGHEDNQVLEDIIDNLREEGCPEDELMDTALAMLAECDVPDQSDPEDSPEENPFWEPYDPLLDFEDEPEIPRLYPHTYACEQPTYCSIC